jgi:cytidine deaminase
MAQRATTRRGLGILLGMLAITVGLAVPSLLAARQICPSGKCPHHPAHCHFCEPDLSGSLSPLDDDRTRCLLIHRAVEAYHRARHSSWEQRRGVALLSYEGLILTGASMESAYSGETLTAESAVVGRAVTEGIYDVHGIVLCGMSPCYPCRRDVQLLSEFNPTMRVLYVDLAGRLLYDVSLKDLERL